MKKVIAKSGRKLFNMNRYSRLIILISLMEVRCQKADSTVSLTVLSRKITKFMPSDRTLHDKNDRRCLGNEFFVKKNYPVPLFSKCFYNFAIIPGSSMFAAFITAECVWRKPGIMKRLYPTFIKT